MTRAALTRISHNRKTGPIPVSTTDSSSCPESCPFKKNGCYAEQGKTAIHWRKLDRGERGKEWAEFCEDVRSLPRKTFWRHDEAGDLPRNQKTDTINLRELKLLVESNRGKRGFTYTHHDMKKKRNRDAVKFCNDNNFVVNLSANNAEHADKLAELGIGPVVCVLPENAPPMGNKTPDGRTIVVCPFDTNGIQCADCQLCQNKDRKSIVGFRAHGIRRKAAELVSKSFSV